MREKIHWLTRMSPMPEHDIYDLIYIFAVGGALGSIYEMLQFLLLHGLLEDRRGSILTPVNYVYGLGALTLFLILYRIQKPLQIFALGAVLGGIVEYSLSIFQEYFLGSRSWDYSARLLNINGRTTLPYMLVWGLLCYLAIRFVFPRLLRLMHRIPQTVKARLTTVLLTVLAVDLTITALAVIRYSQRASGIYFDNRLTALIDRIFDDSYMGVHFPNMRLN